MTFPKIQGVFFLLWEGRNFDFPSARPLGRSMRGSCLNDKTIYHLLKGIELSRTYKIVGTANSAEAVHPTILIEASKADNPQAILKKAIQDGWTAQQVRQEVRRRRKQRKVKLPAIPASKYRCLVIDPPWPKVKIEREVRPRQSGFGYPTMEKDELARLPIPALAGALVLMEQKLRKAGQPPGCSR